MLNSSESELLNQLDGAGGRKFNKREGWYTFAVEEVEEQLNVDEPDHDFTEYNMKLRVLNGPSKGVEFLRISIPPVAHPDFRAKVYGPEGEAVNDEAGNPTFVEPAEPNGRWKRTKGLFEDVMTSVFVGDAVKGRGDEAKAKRKAMIAEKITAGGGIAESLTGKKFIAKLRLDRGFSIDRETGEERVYSPALKKEPRLKPVSFMSFDESREKKYVLAESNLTAPANGVRNKTSINLSL